MQPQINRDPKIRFENKLDHLFKVYFPLLDDDSFKLLVALFKLDMDLINSAFEDQIVFYFLEFIKHIPENLGVIQEKKLKKMFYPNDDDEISRNKLIENYSRVYAAIKSIASPEENIVNAIDIVNSTSTPLLIKTITKIPSFYKKNTKLLYCLSQILTTVIDDLSQALKYRNFQAIEECFFNLLDSTKSESVYFRIIAEEISKIWPSGYARDTDYPAESTIFEDLQLSILESLFESGMSPAIISPKIGELNSQKTIDINHLYRIFRMYNTIPEGIKFNKVIGEDE